MRHITARNWLEQFFLRRNTASVEIPSRLSTKGECPLYDLRLTGHLAPYQGSKELPVESGLPLGLAAQAEYVESTFHLDPDGELTLVTDGIAEARA
jgi:stage II sporulation SpoE-like protein